MVESKSRKKQVRGNSSRASGGVQELVPWMVSEAGLEYTPDPIEKEKFDLKHLGGRRCVNNTIENALRTKGSKTHTVTSNEDEIKVTINGDNIDLEVKLDYVPVSIKRLSPDASTLDKMRALYGECSDIVIGYDPYDRREGCVKRELISAVRALGDQDKADLVTRLYRLVAGGNNIVDDEVNDRISIAINPPKQKKTEFMPFKDMIKTVKGTPYPERKTGWTVAPQEQEEIDRPVEESVETSPSKTTTGPKDKSVDSTSKKKKGGHRHCKKTWSGVEIQPAEDTLESCVELQEKIRELKGKMRLEHRTEPVIQRVVDEVVEYFHVREEVKRLRKSNIPYHVISDSVKKYLEDKEKTLKEEGKPYDYLRKIGCGTPAIRNFASGKFTERMYSLLEGECKQLGIPVLTVPVSSTDLAYFLAAYIFSGGVSEAYTLHTQSSNQVLLKNIQSTIKALTGVTPRIHPPGTRASEHIEFHDNELNEFLQAVTPGKGRVPFEFLRTQEEREAFVRGMLDVRGSMEYAGRGNKYPRVRVCTEGATKELLTGVQVLLYNLGIVSQVREGAKDYELLIKFKPNLENLTKMLEKDPATSKRTVSRIKKLLGGAAPIHGEHSLEDYDNIMEWDGTKEQQNSRWAYIARELSVGYKQVQNWLGERARPNIVKERDYIKNNVVAGDGTKSPYPDIDVMAAVFSRLTGDRERLSPEEAVKYSGIARQVAGKYRWNEFERILQHMNEKGTVLVADEEQLLKQIDETSQELASKAG